MRADVSLNRFGWLYRLDYKKLIIVAFLLRLITASTYDIYVTITGRDILLPDSKFYSVRGRYVDLLLQGYDKESVTRDLLPNDKASLDIFIDTMDLEHGKLSPILRDSTTIFFYVVGIIYFVLGYSTIWVRVFNIALSICSVYLLFRVAKKHFGELAANLFLLIALFLPSQFGYSITLCRDFMRVFIVSFIVWLFYNAGDLWIKRLKFRF